MIKINSGHGDRTTIADHDQPNQRTPITWDKQFTAGYNVKIDQESSN